MIIDPRPMNVMEWTDRMALLVDKYGLTMKLMAPELWQSWAQNVVELVGLSSAELNPYTYDDWLPWAIRFSQDAEPLLQ